MKELEDNKFLTELGKLSTASSRSVAWLSGNFTLGNSSPKIAACWIGIKRKMTRRSQCGLSSRGTLLFFLFVAASAQPHNDCNEPFSDRFSPIVRGLQAHV